MSLIVGFMYYQPAHIASQSRPITVGGATTIEEGHEGIQQNWKPCARQKDFEWLQIWVAVMVY